MGVLFGFIDPVLSVSSISKFYFIEIIYYSVTPGRTKGLTSNLALGDDLFIE